MSRRAKMLVAVAAAGLALSPAFAVSSHKRPAPVSLSFDNLSSFTPANADPKLAAALAGKSLALTDFRFTPAAAKGRPSQVRVAIRARTDTTTRVALAQASAAAPALTPLAPSSYNLGVAVGWRRLAVSGDVAKVKDADSAGGGREAAIVGVSYSLSNRLTTRLAVGADRATGDPVPALRHGNNISVDLGSSYSLSRHIAVTGGVRYNVEHDRLNALQDNRRDSQAVYIGTAFKF